MSIAQVAQYLEEFGATESVKQYDDSLLHSIAAQPSFYRPWLANKNHALLERYVDAHALQRFAITHDPSDTIWSQKRLLIADAAMETWHQDEPPTDGELLAYLISRAVDMADIARELDLARRLQPGSFTLIWSDQTLHDQATNALGSMLLRQSLPTRFHEAIKIVQTDLPRYA
ncbi:hypothetical protein H257_18808 [Aphanomyces astaci]|uniref:Uncharacterized protein n=1 Tax=Aphanomyces astaci TaxID=112090 RepID=W4FBI4_APHAT|nr:hypothetical protein H257_18808 [Aphanomyces astaci]ETV64279.1 hypothetical protein H257_18808 [Aphanomyces astaci]|eukprot:XP_009846236.1 hypothetical protein H257_18808 [Aphanomyces astaci]